MAGAANVDVQVSQFTDSPDPAVRGGNITYTIKLENNSANTAGNVVLTSNLPANSAFVSVNDPAVLGACSHNGATPGIVTCTYPALVGTAVGGPVQTITMVLKSTGATVITLNPSVSVTTTDTDTNPANDTLSQNTTIDDGANLFATLAGAPNPVTAGGNITWTINGGNNGPNDAGNVQVVTTLPATLTFVSASGGGFNCTTAGSPVVVTCTRAALATGAAFANLNIVTQETGASSGTVALGANITSSVGDPDTSDNNPTANVSINAGADLRITQNAPSVSPALSNQNVTFTLNASNLGPSADTAGITVTYQLPAGFTYVSGTPSGANWQACTVAANLVTCVNNANYAVGRNDTISIVATTPVVAVQTAFNNITATIAPNAGSAPDPVAGNNTAQVNLSVTPDGVDLSLVKNKSPNPVAQGGTITSTLVIHNAGPQNAATGTITVTDVLDVTREAFVSATGSNWACVFASPNVNCTYNAVLNNGANAATLTVTTTALTAGAATNNASVAYSGVPGDWNPANNGPVAGTVTITTVANSPDLLLTVAAATAGGVATTLEFDETTLTYTLTLTNKVTSPVAAQDIVVTDAIPGFITGVTPAPVIGQVLTNTSGTSTAAFGCVTSAGGTVTCTQTGGTLLQPGDVMTFTLPLLRNLTAGNFTNTATAFSSTQGDPVRGDNTASVAVQIDPIADVQMVNKVISSHPGGTALAGTNVTYILTFRNNGPSPAANVHVIDAFTVGGADPGFTFVSATPTQGSCGGLTAGTTYGTTNALDCNIGVLNNGQQETVTVVIRPNWKAGQVAGVLWPINNTASITTVTKENSAGTDNGNNSVPAVINVDAATLDALINNTDTPDPLGFDPVTAANNDITYLQQITNRGPSLATGLRFTYAMTPPAGKTVRFRGDGSAANVATTVATPIPGSICDNLGNTVTGPATMTVTCTFSGAASALAANASTSRYLVFRVVTAPDPTGNTLNTNATVITNETDSNAANNSEGETTSVRVRADLTLTKSPSANPVQIRQPFNWNIAVTNGGPGDSQLTSLTDTLPAGMAFSGAAPSWTKTGGGSGVCATAGQVLTCSFGVLINGGTVTLTVPVRMTAFPAGGTVQNCATATTSEVDPSTANNVTVCNAPLLTVQKASLAGAVYADKNNNGVIDAGEGGISGVTLTLTGTDLYGNAVNTPVLTAADGSYLFDNVSPADATGYTITETQPPTYGDGLETVGSVAGSSSPANDQFRVVLPANTAATGYNFGELGVSIAGKVFVDSVAVNSQFDPGEPGITGVTITLSGNRAGGTNVCTVLPPGGCVTTTNAAGNWSFPALPPSDAAGYTFVETQPGAYTNSGDQAGTAGEIGAHVLNRFVVNLSIAGTQATGYNFGEIAIAGATASVSGRVWLDRDHDRIYGGAGDTPQPGWTVELIRAGIIVASQSTNALGQYSFTGLPPGAGYQLQFRHPTTGLIFGRAVPNETGTAYVSGVVSAGNPTGAATVNGVLSGITLNAGDNIVQQSLPLDPAGVVYDAVTRNPVAGAVITITGPGGFNPAVHVVGGSATFTTGLDGLYQFLLNPGAPNGNYTLTVTTFPAGYVPQPSTLIPVCAPVLNVGAAPNPLLIQTSNIAPALGTPLHVPAICPAASAGVPAGAGTTQYYFTFTLTSGVSANVLNNHIPLDPVLGSAVLVQKTTPLVNVTRGDLVPYTIIATNTLGGALNNVTLQDQIPPGFRYRSGTATLNGVVLEPAIVGRTLSWANLSFAAGERKVFRMVLIVGAGVAEGQYVNSVFALNALLGSRISNVATATVRIVPDPTFDCSDIIGKVFDDRNVNGYQDDGEPGIANVRVVTPRGLLVTTDADGRFHVTCADVPNADRGANFVMKLDDRTLPSGYRVTTENPHSVRVTRGKMAALNFGAAIHRVVRVEVADAAFVPQTDRLLPEWLKKIDALPAQLKDKPSVVRVAYARGSEAGDLVAKRVAALIARIRERWQALGCCYPLTVEDEARAGSGP